MKKTACSALSLVLVFVMIYCFVSCGKELPEGLWATAKYSSDTSFGEGAKTVTVYVEVAEKKVAFTIHTDAETLGEALLAHDLIAGDMGEFGMYIKQVIGITADYDVDRSYWGFYKDGEYMMTGVDATVIADGERYELVYTK